MIAPGATNCELTNPEELSNDFPKEIRGNTAALQGVVMILKKGSYRKSDPDFETAIAI